MERIPPPEPHRDKPFHGFQQNHCRAIDALQEIDGSASYGATAIKVVRQKNGDKDMQAFRRKNALDVRGILQKTGRRPMNA